MSNIAQSNVTAVMLVPPRRRDASAAADMQTSTSASDLEAEAMQYAVSEFELVASG